MRVGWQAQFSLKCVPEGADGCAAVLLSILMLHLAAHPNPNRENPNHFCILFTLHYKYDHLCVS